MTPVEFEFIKLKRRYRLAVEYEKTCAADTPERYEMALIAFGKVLKRMSELWNEMANSEKARHMDL